MKTEIDWSTRPAPYCYIGPAFRKEVEQIMAGSYVTQPLRHRDRGDPAGTELRQRRCARGLSQSALGRLAGCDPSLISRLESGATTASAALWRRIDAALGSP